MSASPTDLYAVLGVGRGATPTQITHAYRAAVRRLHPDSRAPQSPASGPAATAADRELQRILDAYAVLRDPQRRADYDRQLTPDTLTAPESAPAHETVLAPGTVRVRVTRTAAGPQRAWASRGEPPLAAGPVRWQPSASGRDARRR